MPVFSVNKIPISPCQEYESNFDPSDKSKNSMYVNKSTQNYENIAQIYLELISLR
jgi:hypothetical protein